MQVIGVGFSEIQGAANDADLLKLSKQKYKELARSLHPKHGGRDVADAEKAFVLVREAFAILCPLLGGAVRVIPQGSVMEDRYVSKSKGSAPK